MANSWRSEGESFRIIGNIDGPRVGNSPYGALVDPPTLTIRVDKNFEGDFDDSGEVIHHNWTQESYSGYFDYSFLIEDDGISPGDAMPANLLRYELELPDDFRQPTSLVFNVAPAPTSNAALHTELDVNNDLKVTLSRPRFFDPGALDSHQWSVKWGDNETEDVIVSASTTRIYPLSSGSPTPVVYPVTIEIKDDDNGLRRYRMEKLVVGLNDDDDNGNRVQDRYDDPGSVAENDLVELDLSSIIANRPESTGSLFIEYNDVSILSVCGQNRPLICG